MHLLLLLLLEVQVLVVVDARALMLCDLLCELLLDVATIAENSFCWVALKLNRRGRVFVRWSPMMHLWLLTGSPCSLLAASRVRHTQHRHIFIVCGSLALYLAHVEVLSRDVSVKLRSALREVASSLERRDACAVLIITFLYAR